MEIVTKDNIDPILQSGENSIVEFKASVESGINVLPRSISAFANTEGGVIIMGYDERTRTVTGTSADEFERVKRVICTSKLEDVCNAYIVEYKKKILIIIQIEKSKSVVIAGGGAYIKKDTSISVMNSNEMLVRIDSMLRTIRTPEEIKNESEKKIEQIYDELLRIQKEHKEELERKKKEHEKETRITQISNWFFCILSAVMGWGLGKFF